MAKTKQQDQDHFVFEPKSQYKAGQVYKPFIPGPNPELSEFIKKHSIPYDEKTDQYDVQAFDRDLIVNKAAAPKAIYDMHTYWSKKHWAAIREYIRHYLPKKYYPAGTGLVLDCFSGSGMTGVSAMMENRPCVLIDASPAAAFISHCYTHPVDPQELQNAYEHMMTSEYPEGLKKKLKAATGEDIANLQKELDWLYATKCDRCGGDATTEYVVYSEQFQCPRCGEIVALFDCPETKVPYQVGSKTKQKVEMKKRRVCPHCLKKYEDPHRDFVISTRTIKFGSVPTLLIYECQGKCKPKRGQRRHDEQSERKASFFKQYDIKKINHIDISEIPHWHPDRTMMDIASEQACWGYLWRKGIHKNIKSVTDFYTKRNLWALAAIKSAINRLTEHNPAIEICNVGFTAVSMNASNMYRYRPSLKGGIANGTYYLPQIAQVMRASSQFIGKKKDVLGFQVAMLPYSSSTTLVSTENTTEAQIKSESIDYIFTDPPYVDKIQYGELNFIWESWLGYNIGWRNREIIVNPILGKTLDEWNMDIRKALMVFFNGLKPGHWLSLCYHDTDPSTWSRLQDTLLDCGFEVHSVTVLDPMQKSKNQLVAEKVVKSDLVLNCRKPRSGEQSSNGEVSEVSQVSRRVRDILIEILSNSGGQTRDKLWDIVLKRLLSRGQMAEHRFEDILNEVAVRSESGRWFLKEEYESLSQSDINNEDAAGSALERFARLRCAGTPVNFAAQIALSVPHLVSDAIDERKVEEYIRNSLIQYPREAKNFTLGGRMKGVEFYDCLFFYLTRFLKGRAAGQTPRRNLAEFLEEYLVRFKDGDKWLYRPPDQTEAAGLRKARQTGLGRRIRQYISFLKGEGEYPAEKIPGPKTIVAWLKHCAAFGLAEEGVLLFEKGGLAGRLMQLSEDERYDAEDYYAQCRRKAVKKTSEEDMNLEEAEEDEG